MSNWEIIQSQVLNVISMISQIISALLQDSFILAIFCSFLVFVGFDLVEIAFSDKYDGDGI